MCVVSWPLAESWFFMTSGKSGGDEYGAISSSSNSPLSSLNDTMDNCMRKEAREKNEVRFDFH